MKTLTEARLTEFLKYSEMDICDFKEQIYNLSDEKSKVSFLKDILSMANTIRYESAYIIIGIRQKDGHTEYVDVNPNIDEANYVEFIKGNTTPEFPDVSYYTMPYKKHCIGVFEIGAAKLGPYVSKKTFGDKVKANQVYYRLGSVNTEASPAKEQEIKQWMENGKKDNYKIVAQQLDLANQNQYNYILFFGEDYPLSTKQYEILSNVNWSVIIDFTRNTETSGLYHFSHNEKLSRHRIVPDSECPQFYEGSSQIWFLAPVSNKAGSEVIDTRSWSRNYFSSVNECLRDVIDESSKQIIFVSMFTGVCKQAAVDNLVTVFANNPLFKKHVDFTVDSSFLVEDTDPEFVDVSCLCDDICSAFASNRSVNIGNGEYYLVEDDLFPVTSPAWIHEELEPLYVNIDEMEEFNKTSSYSYFQGREICWNEMNPCIAAERRKYSELIPKISHTFERNVPHPEILQVDYEAGSGVTTVLRKLAWFYHNAYPVVWLKQYSKDGTRERLRSLSNDVNRNRILLVIDIHDFDIQLINELKHNLEVDNIPITILFSKRYMEGGVENFLEEQLKGNEIRAFDGIYAKQVSQLELSESEKEKRLEAIHTIQSGDANAITPFSYALCTFEDSFVKLSDYVRQHLNQINELQQKILLLISTIHYYTGLEIPQAIIQKVIEREGGLRLNTVLSKEQYKLLIITGDGIKTLHHTVSGEILKQVCSYGMTNEQAWVNKLEPVFEMIISELESYKNNDKAMRILKALFLNQQPSGNKGNDNSETKHFSYAIESLAMDISKKNILELLCSKFSRNPYVYSNMARYYHYVEGNEDQALEFIQKALSLSEDYTFYHLQGVALAKKMRNYIQNNVAEIMSDYPAFVRKLQTTLSEVEMAYDKSIELNYNNMYAYTGKMNYPLGIIGDTVKYICPNLSVPQMLKMEKYAWCNDYIAVIDETIETIRAIDLYTDSNHEDVIENYESQLCEMEGNPSEAINGWRGLLDNQAVYHPPIRRNMVRGYFRMCDKNWISLESKKQDTVRTLLEDNIKEQPENVNNIIQWFDFARYFNNDLNKTISYFKQYVAAPNLEYYYRGMLAFFAYGLEYKDKTYIRKGIELSNKCEELAREKDNRRRLRDIYDPKGKSMSAIKAFKIYQRNAEDYDSALASIDKVSGHIVRIDKPEVGWISMDNYDITIKFNPSYNHQRIFRQTKDEGVRVEFVLGFRVQGVFAYAVTPEKKKTSDN